MIDISQWRASIGLWYYQICDNVIDKSLPALCRKGTRANKQSSNEKHSNRNSTAVEQISSNEIPQSNRRQNIETPVALPNSSTANTTSRYADWCGSVQTISLAVFLFFLLILSGDIELNPGPKTGNNYIVLLYHSLLLDLTSSNVLRLLVKSGFDVEKKWSKLIALIGVSLNERIRLLQTMATNGYDYYCALEKGIQWWIDNGTNVSWNELISAIENCGGSNIHVANKIKREINIGKFNM